MKKAKVASPIIRSPIAADTGTRHRNKIAPDPG